jgi:hypothetical protein
MNDYDGKVYTSIYRNTKYYIVLSKLNKHDNTLKILLAQIDSDYDPVELFVFNNIPTDANIQEPKARVKIDKQILRPLIKKVFIEESTSRYIDCFINNKVYKER